MNAVSLRKLTTNLSSTTEKKYKIFYKTASYYIKPQTESNLNGVYKFT